MQSYSDPACHPSFAIVAVASSVPQAQNRNDCDAFPDSGNLLKYSHLSSSSRPGEQEEQEVPRLACGGCGGCGGTCAERILLIKDSCNISGDAVQIEL